METRPNIVESGNHYDGLKSLIEERRYKEKECTPYLKYAYDTLLKTSWSKIDDETINENLEYRGHSGDVDLIVSGKIRTTEGVEQTHLYMWELKAPQCPIFEKDTKDRLRPSKFLVDAENKLINYYHEHKSSNSLCSKHGVHPNYIKLGGIIIGCDRTRVSGSSDYTEADKIHLYEEAVVIRNEYLYKSAGITLVTWSEILNVIPLSSTERTDKEFSGPSIEIIIPKTPNSSATGALEELIEEVIK